VKAHWTQFLATYISTRQALKGLVVIMDARHPMRPLDIELLDWYRPTNKPAHILLTKADKLTRAEQAGALREVNKQIVARQYNATAQLFSSLKKTGVPEAEIALGRLFALEEPHLSA
jgi:GTP-binding protein